MRSGIHANSVAGASLDAVAAINTAQSVDFIADRKLLYRLVRVLAGFDVNALRGTCGGAQKARRTLHRAVVFERKPVAAAIRVRIGPALLGILHGNRGG